MEFNGFRKALDGLLLTKYPFIKSYKIHENRIYKNKIFLELLGRWDKPISEKLYNVAGQQYNAKRQEYADIAKANGYRYLFVNNNSAIAASSVFDLQAGTVITTTGSATITSVGSGWYRCSVTGVAPSTGIPGFYWQFNSTYATGDQSFAGDGTSSIYFWGGQWHEELKRDSDGS